MKTLTFKVTEEEAQRIRALAKGEGLSVSEYLRRRARGSKGSVPRPKLVRCPHTGAKVFGALRGEPPLTTKAVRELLSDFP